MTRRLAGLGVEEVLVLTVSAKFGIYKAQLQLQRLVPDVSSDCEMLVPI
jgi:hypothetical protein